MGQIVEVVGLSFDKKKNRLVIIMSNGDKAEVDPFKIMETIPIKNAREKIDGLLMMIHYIDREQIMEYAYNIPATVKVLNKGIQNAMEELKKCTGDMTCVKQWQAISKTFVDQKNNLKEVRLSIKELNRKKMELRAKIAALGYDPDEEKLIE